MAALRKPFEGIINIIRFNWHFYLLAISFIFLLIIFRINSVPPLDLFLLILTSGILLTLLTSLLVSYYIYDISDLYSYNWMPDFKLKKTSKIINIHAGFDETSKILHSLFPDARLEVYDFYDPLKHTEPSVKRARKAYSPYPGTISVSTSSFPVMEEKADLVCLLLSAHEIRNDEERINFFSDLGMSLTSNGKILVIEHLRDWPNFLAYTIGFFHFYTHSSWLKTFTKSGFQITNEFKITPFISSFILEKNGNSS